MSIFVSIFVGQCCNLGFASSRTTTLLGWWCNFLRHFPSFKGPFFFFISFRICRFSSCYPLFLTMFFHSCFSYSQYFSFNCGLPSMHFTSKLGLSLPGRNLEYSHSWKQGCWCASVLSRLSFFMFNQFFIKPCFWKTSFSGDKRHSLQLCQQIWACWTNFSASLNGSNWTASYSRPPH